MPTHQCLRIGNRCLPTSYSEAMTGFDATHGRNQSAVPNFGFPNHPKLIHRENSLNISNVWSGSGGTNVLYQFIVRRHGDTQLDHEFTVGDRSIVQSIHKLTEQIK